MGTERPAAQRRLAARYRAEEGNVRLRRQQLADRVAQQPIVLDQQDRDRYGHGREQFCLLRWERSGRLASGAARSNPRYL